MKSVHVSWRTEIYSRTWQIYSPLFLPFVLLFPPIENMKVKLQLYFAQRMLLDFCPYFSCNSRSRPIQFTSQGPYVWVNGGSNMHRRGTMNYSLHFCVRAPQDASWWSCVGRPAVCSVSLSETMCPVRA